MLKLGKGWRKWLMIGFIVVLVALAVLAFTTGCSSKPEPATATPLQALQTDVDAVEADIATLKGTVAGNGNSISGLGTRATNLETWKTSADERLANLEMGGLPEANLSDIEARLTFLELQYEGIINSGTPTPTPTGTSPTPTPTPIVQCGVQRPTLTIPAYGGTINAGTVNFQWNTCANAVHYEFYLGTTPDVTKVMNIFSPFHSIPYPADKPDTYYYWKVISVSPCGDKTESDGWWFKTAP